MKNEKISFVSKEPINIMLIERYEDYNFDNLSEQIIIQKKIKNKNNYNKIICKCLFNCICLYNVSLNAKSIFNNINFWQWITNN